MILDRIENAACYEKLNPNLKAAFDFLRQDKLMDIKDGRYEIDGEKVCAVVMRASGKKKAETKLEAHKKYIDIHYTVSGTDVLGWKSCHVCASSNGYDAENDFELYNEAPDTWITVPPGNFALCFPEDTHAPLATEETVHKIVLKVIV